MKNYNQAFGFYLPTKLVYEIGAIKNKLASEIKVLNTDTVTIVTDKGVIGAGLLKNVEAALNEKKITYNIFDGVEPNPSTDTCYQCAETAKAISAGAFIAVGGGSPMDVAKTAAILMTNGGNLDKYEGVDKFEKDPLPILAIPTTAGTGSEVTPFAVITIRARNYKMTIVSYRFLPKVAFLDPTVLTSIPPHIAASCGMDALTHAIESYTNLVASPFTDAFGAEAIRLIGKYLRAFVANRADMEAAGAMCVASNLAGIAFGIARLGNVHAMAHPLSGFFNVPHGVANAIILTKVMEYNMLADHGKYKRIAALMGEDVSGLSDLEAAPIAIEAVQNLADDVGIPKTLTEVGVKKDKIEEMAKDAMLSGNVKINPRMSTLKDIINLYLSAM
ncbi:MAG: iron-containing alcohol dehydrogenase [Desulfobacterales bacterium]|nr:iron-containing alcohol dehydrogenase [Desulfobacterales bacterium]MDD4072576.1 iron-containing alcohol dehydrogenase [Desulfobacterales bacterium]MDD4393866.1 iron-containing alcohol dehydrogenase [Desulfobacterales bacterium]